MSARSRPKCYQPGPDVSRWFVHRLVEAGIPRMRAIEAGLAMREQYGGRRLYVRKRPPERATARAATAGEVEVADAAAERL